MLPNYIDILGLTNSFAAALISSILFPSFVGIILGYVIDGFRNQHIEVAIIRKTNDNAVSSKVVIGKPSLTL